MPELGSTIQLVDPKTNSLVYQQGGWDMNSESYIEEVLDLYDSYFAELNDLITRTNYFKKDSGKDIRNKKNKEDLEDVN